MATRIPSRAAALAVALALAAPFALPEAAEAAPVTVTGAPASYDLSFSRPDSNGATLTATGTLTVNSITATTMQIALSLTNTTSAVGTNRITAFAFDIDPGAVGSATSLTNSWGVAVNTNFPSFNTVDVCAFDTNSCTGAGGKEGIFEGATESVVLNLTGTFQTPFDIVRVGIRFASVGTGSSGSFTFAGTIAAPASTSPAPGVTVPEPGTLALFGAGLAGLGLALRRRRTAAAV